MSAICGVVVPGGAAADSKGAATAAAAAAVRAMLDAVEYRGDCVDVAVVSGAVLGCRWWRDRPGVSPGVHRRGNNDGKSPVPAGSASVVACAGTFAPPVTSPAAELPECLLRGLAELDGGFAGAWWEGKEERLTLVRDPFGVCSLYFVEHAGALYFASEIKQLLAVSGLPVEADPLALHKYLTFSFVPGEDMPVRGVRRLLPGHVSAFQRGQWKPEPYFSLRESIDPALNDQQAAVRLIAARCREAVQRRLGDDEAQGRAPVGVYLSGGIDSSAVACWLKDEGAEVRAFTLDFGNRSVEREQAAQVAENLGIPLTLVPAEPDAIAANLAEIAWKLDLPFGDPVTGPQYLLGRAARAAGIRTVFNGEGGDQLFGGWTSKPMISAQIFAGLFGPRDPAEQYLQSYHRFHGLEDELYTETFCASVGQTAGRRRALLTPHLGGGGGMAFLNGVRLADIALKGSHNILPRAECMTGCWGLDLRVPFFDRRLAEASFRLPPSMKLRGACEKFVLKLALQKHLPEVIIWRRKFGMSVPATDWLLGPLAPLAGELLATEAVRRRGLFRPDFVERLRRGEHAPAETRRRRLGEKLWTLLMLEAWMRVFIDGRGKRPASL